MISGLSLCSMETVGIIASLVAAFASLMTLWYTIRMSRGNVRRRIERKRGQIGDIDNQLCRKYGLNDNGFGRPQTSLDRKKSQLYAEIEELEKEL